MSNLGTLTTNDICLSCQTKFSGLHEYQSKSITVDEVTVDRKESKTESDLG